MDSTVVVVLVLVIFFVAAIWTGKRIADAVERDKMSRRYQQGNAQREQEKRRASVQTPPPPPPKRYPPPPSQPPTKRYPHFAQASQQVRTKYGESYDPEWEDIKRKTDEFLSERRSSIDRSEILHRTGRRVRAYKKGFDEMREKRSLLEEKLDQLESWEATVHQAEEEELALDVRADQAVAGYFADTSVSPQERQQAALARDIRAMLTSIQHKLLDFNFDGAGQPNLTVAEFVDWRTRLNEVEEVLSDWERGLHDRDDRLKEQALQREERAQFQRDLAEAQEHIRGAQEEERRKLPQSRLNEPGSDDFLL